MGKINWPEEIPIPTKIGDYKFFIDDQPNCAIGHLQSLGVWSNHTRVPDQPTKKIGRIYYQLYKRLFVAMFPQCYSSKFLFYINDRLPTAARTNLYLLTWAKLGYTEGMPEHILKLLNIPAIKKIEVDFAIQSNKQ